MVLEFVILGRMYNSGMCLDVALPESPPAKAGILTTAWF